MKAEKAPRKPLDLQARAHDRLVQLRSARWLWGLSAS